MSFTTRVTNWPALLLAFGSWLLGTWLYLEKMLTDGVQSYALLLSAPMLTAAICLLVHLAYTGCRDLNPVRFVVASVLAVGCLSVTIPASIGSSAGAKDTAVAKAEASNRAATTYSEDLRNISKTLKWAEEDMVSECASGEGVACRGKRSTVKALQDRKDKLTGEFQAAPAAKTALSGETRIAWALGLLGLKVSEADIQMGQPMLLPFILELLSPAFTIWAFAGRRETFVTQAASKPISLTDSAQTSFDVSRMAALPKPEVFYGELPPPPKVKRPKSRRKAKNANAIAWVREQTLAGHRPKFSVVRGRHRLSKSSASRALAEGIRLAACA